MKKEYTLDEKIEYYTKRAIELEEKFNFTIKRLNTLKYIKQKQIDKKMLEEIRNNFEKNFEEQNEKRRERIKDAIKKNSKKAPK